MQWQHRQFQFQPRLRLRESGGVCLAVTEPPLTVYTRKRAIPPLSLPPS